MAKKAPSKSAGANDLKSVLAWLESRGSKKAREEMGPRYGIWTDKAFGVSVGDMRKLAKEIGKDYPFAQKLWVHGWHDTRMLATMIADPKLVTPAQMDAWCKDFDTWAITDTACFVLFDKTPHAFAKIKQWAKCKPEFEKRAAFALLASVALHDKKSEDKPFSACFPLIRAAANDERNFVKKGVSWALRGIAGRSTALRDAAIDLAEELAASENATERWVGKDVLRDIKRPMIAQRAQKREAAQTRPQSKTGAKNTR
ncbi:MAG TPA: DNA alkylation repair protein [Flavobacteriales bacterium]|nr:DNA alkylation repair protein [Flavobacteriales bacterium]